MEAWMDVAVSGSPNRTYNPLTGTGDLTGGKTSTGAYTVATDSDRPADPGRDPRRKAVRRDPDRRVSGRPAGRSIPREHRGTPRGMTEGP